MSNNVNKKILNVPHLRFNEEIWQVKTLGEICSKFDYGLGAEAIEYDGVNKYIRITDIDDETSCFNCAKMVSPSYLDDQCIVQKNDILFARTGASTGKTYIYNEKDGKLYFAGFLIRVNVNNDYDPYFIFQQTKTQKYKNWVKITSARSGQPGINAQEYKNYKIFYPSLLLQNKISKFLNLLDIRIQTQNKIIRKYESLIQGIIDNIFSDNGLYSIGDEYKLEDILIPCAKNPVNTSDYKKITIKLHYGGIEFSENSRVMADTRPFYLRHTNEIIIGKQNYFNGSIAIISPEFNNTICSNAIMSFSVKNNYDLTFIYYCISNKTFLSRRAFFADGTGQKELSEKEFLDFKIRAPIYDKQKEIGLLLKKINQMKELELSYLNQLHRQKHFFLCNMFI